MPRKIRVQKRAQPHKLSRAEIVLYVVTAIIAVSMVFGTILASAGR